MIAARYQEICRRHCPTLTLSEWCAVMDALNGIWLHDTSPLTSIWAEVYDADRLNGLGQKWGVDAKALAQRIREYDYATLVALVDAVERWWAIPTDDTRPYKESIPEVVGAEHVSG
jgi:hypothetical protein